MKQILFSLLILVMLTSACQTEQKRKEFVTIKIFTTTDVHGAIFPYDFIKDREVMGSLAQVSNYVNAVRADTTCEVVLLDNGDILQGQPVVYYYNFEDTSKAHILSRVMQYMEYDAGTVGNHDIEAGHSVYDRLNREFSFPWLAANARITGSKETYFKPYTIIERSGVKIAVIGLITPAIPKWLPENIWEGMEFDDMIESARFWIKTVKEKENPEIIVGLAHSGVDFTYSNQQEDTPKNENASLLVAKNVSGFDVIFAGHDHKVFDTIVKNPNGENVFIIDANCYGKMLGELSVELTLNKKTNEYDKEVMSRLVDMRKIEPDSIFMSIFEDDFKVVKKYVSGSVGRLTEPISSRESLFGNSAFADLIHRIQLDLTQADISFTAPLSFSSTIDYGNIYVRDMFKLYRFENLLYTMELTGKEIDDFLEFSYAGWFNTMKDKNDNLLKFKISNRGKKKLAGQFYNFSSAAGIIYEVDVSKTESNRVTIISMADGTAFDMKTKYKVAINSYRGNGGGGHLIEGAKISKEELKSRILHSTEKDLRFYMMNWLKEQKVIKPEKYGNWKVIPEDWVKTATQTDYEILFGSRK